MPLHILAITKHPCTPSARTHALCTPSQVLALCTLTASHALKRPCTPLPCLHTPCPAHRHLHNLHILRPSHKPFHTLTWPIHFLKTSHASTHSSIVPTPSHGITCSHTPCMPLHILAWTCLLLTPMHARPSPTASHTVHILHDVALLTSSQGLT